MNSFSIQLKDNHTMTLSESIKKKDNTKELKQRIKKVNDKAMKDAEKGSSKEK